MTGTAAFRIDRFTRGRLDLINRPTAGPNTHSVAVDTNTGHIFLPTIDIRGVPVPAPGRWNFDGGGIGLWTKADSVTCFDDVQLTTR